MPQANSTTSMPRATSPSASAWVLPCSLEMARAMSAACLSSSSLNLNMKRARFSGGVRPQAGAASFAACDGAVPTSAALERPSSAVCSPVAGLKTGDTAARG